MPTNPNKDALIARRYISKRLSELPKEGILLKDLELQVLLSHPVSDSYPKRFIKEFFLDTGICELDGGMIKRRE